MHQYITDTQYAVRELINLITNEETQIHQSEKQYEMLKFKEDSLSKQLTNASLNENVPVFQDQFIAINFHKTREESEELRRQIEELKISIDVKSYSTDALCGAVLQIAKQGISTVYGSLSECPSGREIGEGANAEVLKNVIWQARNQSLHHEDGSFSASVIECFNKLEVLFGSNFSLSSNRGRNLARYVIQELGWKKYLQYESDMQSLLD